MTKQYKMNLNQKVTDYIDKASEEQIVVLEKVKWNMPVFNNGKDFAYLRFAKNHITFGFYNIDKIQDPDNLLEGEGNTLKHIKIRSKNEIKPTVLADWLKQITS